MQCQGTLVLLALSMRNKGKDGKADIVLELLKAVLVIFVKGKYIVSFWNMRLEGKDEINDVVLTIVLYLYLWMENI